MNYIAENGNIRILDVKDLDLAQTLDCGQAFRWEKKNDGSFVGVAFEQSLRLYFEGNDLILENTSMEQAAKWIEYMDLETEYAALKMLFSQHEILAKAIEFAPGIRILRQEKWEALCSFIISQNNNVSRIKVIISHLCAQFGKDLGGGQYGFPSAETLSTKTIEDLAPIKAGFRTRYILDAAKKIASKEVDLHAIDAMPLAQARTELMKIVGVGEKVADCALLFGFYKVECYPVDVWIKRVNQFMFPEGLPAYVLPYAGIAQQYLFHYARVCPEAFAFAEVPKKSTAKV